MWDLLVVDPITNLLLLFYKYMGHQTILAITVLTLVVRLALTPLTISQQKSMARQRDLQPRLKELQEKYKNDKQKLAEEQMKLYQEMGLNPAGGCLPLLIQMPLMIGLYQAIIRALAATPIGLLNLASHVYHWLPGLSTVLPMQSHFLWLDLALPDPYYIMPILVVATSWYQQKVITATQGPTSQGDSQAQAMSQSMQITMPLFMGFISMSYASGLSVYFIISNLVGIFQYTAFRNQLSGAGVESTSKPPKAGKKKR